MADSDKDILITPNTSETADPKIDFVGASSTLGPQTITLNVYPNDNGTLSFEGSAGQLFSITNDLTGTIFSVNDVSGIPSIEVIDDGTVSIAEFNGNVLIGTATDNGTDKLQINGDVSATTFKGALVGNATTATTLQTARTINGTSFNGSANITTNIWGTARTINGTSINGSTNYTTANWGTARTLTIGSTGKSVNGSANVAWSLSEIGAADATATVNLTGNQTIAGTKTFSSAVVLSTAGTATTHAVRADRSISTAGIATGGGNLTANRTISVPGTNLGITAGTTAGPIVTSSTGTNATLPTASGTASGVVTTGNQTISGIKTFSGTELRVGGSNTENYISFRGTTGDGPGSFNHTYIGERLYGGTEQSELFLFKGNDSSTSSGYDRIRLAGAAILFDTYTAATSGTFSGVATSANLINRFTMTPEGNATFNVDLRAPIFYDSNNTGYRTNPASTSVMNTIDLEGTIRHNGDTNTYIQFHAADQWRVVTDGSERLEVNNTATTGGRIDATSQMRSPIYYDRNNTSYYVHADSTSYFAYLGRRAHQTGHLVGSYNSVGANSQKSNPIYTIGSNYNPAEEALNNMYGIGYSHTNASFYGLSGASGWGMYVAADGDARVILSGSNGAISATGDITAYASDGRLKTNIKPIENALEKVQKIRGVTYDWVNNITSEYDFHPGSMHEVGVISQEIEKVLPEIVTEAPFNFNYTKKTGVDHKFQTVKYDRLAPLLIEAVKEQQQIIQEQDDRITRLEKLVNTLVGKE